MRRPLLALAAVSAAALGASAADAQTRTLNWPGKTERVQPAPEAAPEAPPEAPQADSVAPPPVPEPFVAYTPGAQPRARNNRYSPRSGAPRVAPRSVLPAYIQPAPAVVRSAPRPTTAPAPAYAPTPVAAPRTDYGPPVIPNEVRPAARPVTAQPRPTPRPVEPAPAPVVAAQPRAKPAAAQPAPAPARAEAPARTAPVQAAPAPVVRAEAPAPKPAKAHKPARAAAPPAAPEIAPAAPAATARNTERPFVRPAQGSGPRFYSVHREFGQQPDAAQRSATPGAPTAERLPAGFFASNPAPADEDAEEVVDDAESRNAAIRAEVKRQVAAQPARRR